MMMVAVLLSRVLGLIRDRVIAMKFGQGFETDAYNAAFTVPDLLSYVIAGGAISSPRSVRRVKAPGAPCNESTRRFSRRGALKGAICCSSCDMRAPAARAGWAGIS